MLSKQSMSSIKAEVEIIADGITLKGILVAQAGANGLTPAL